MFSKSRFLNTLLGKPGRQSAFSPRLLLIRENGVPRDGFLSGNSLFKEVGISAKDVERELKRNPQWEKAENEMERRFNSFLFIDTIVPALRQLGLMNDRTEPWYRQLGVLQMAA